MRGVDWFFIFLIIVGVPLSWESTKAYFRMQQMNPLVIIRLLLGYGYCLAPPIAVIILHYTGAIQ